MLSLLLASWLSMVPAHAETFETVLTSIFKTTDGQPVTPRALGQGKGYLVMFWAGWCVPCKEELALVAAHPDAVAGFEVIAVNVDDSGGRTRAEGILRQMSWPFHSLFDESGSVFYQINSSGELPLALVFDPEGHLIEILRELKEPQLETLRGREFRTGGGGAGWTISEEFQYVDRNVPGGHSVVGTNTLGVRWAAREWQVAASHNLLRQQRDPASGWGRFEDEVGFSYAQWQSEGDDLTRMRVGDDAVEWGKGALLSARAIPGTNTNASLLGAHVTRTSGDWSFSASAGRVREQLFGLLLDPTVDITPSLPRETVYGGTVTKNFRGSEYKGKIALAAARYHRDALAGTAFLNAYDDRRAQVNAAIGRDTWGVEALQTRYFIDETDRKASDESQVDAYLRSAGDARLQLGATYLQKRDSLPRVFTPVLTEYPALPLLVDDLRSWRIAPRLVLGDFTFEPQWVAEQSSRSLEPEKQNTYVLQLLEPKHEFKAIAVYQRHGSTPLDLDADVYAGLLGGALSRAFTAQLEYKTYKATGRGANRAADQGGLSAAAQVGVKIEHLLDTRKIGQMVLSYTRTQQDGYWRAVSGIDRKELNGYRLTWTRGPLELRLAACQEPGGIVCSGGVCAQRPPLNGFSVASKMHWDF